MATLTYTDLEGGAPTIRWHGREFMTTVPVEVDPEKDGDLIEAAKGNRFFAFDDKAGGAPKHDDTIIGKGEQAARDGKKRLVPVAYRGDDKKAQAEAWLFGYDRIPQSDDPYADPKEKSDAAPKETPLAANSSTQANGPISPTQVLQNDKTAVQNTADDGGKK